MKGHVTPGATVAELDERDRELAFVTETGSRLCRCLRCDPWVDYEAPSTDAVTSDTMPTLAELPRPLRGKALDERVVVRAISIERWIHVAFFAMLAILLVVVELGLPWIHQTASQMLHQWQQLVTDSRPASSILSKGLAELSNLDAGHVRVLLAVAIGYGLLEGVKAFYLWRGKRWAEYLTVLATALLLPLAIQALLEKVTIPRISGLVLDLAILAYRVVAKRLFGVRGGQKRLEAELNKDVNWDELHTRAPIRIPTPGSTTAE